MCKTGQFIFKNPSAVLGMQVFHTSQLAGINTKGLTISVNTGHTEPGGMFR